MFLARQNSFRYTFKPSKLFSACEDIAVKSNFAFWQVQDILNNAIKPELHGSCGDMSTPWGGKGEQGTVRVPLLSRDVWEPEHCGE